RNSVTHGETKTRFSAQDVVVRSPCACPAAAARPGLAGGRSARHPRGFGPGKRQGGKTRRRWRNSHWPISSGSAVVAGGPPAPHPFASARDAAKGGVCTEGYATTDSLTPTAPLVV